jgi:SAM-dependent methyltransferase
MKHEDKKSSIKFYVKRFIIKNAQLLKGKKIVDFPAGNGITSRIIDEVGGIPIPLDLFPEYFQIDRFKCLRANIEDGLPLDEQSADYIFCQEGIEHFSDQMQAFNEFNRVLKNKGTLIITTPNYSSLRSKMSYLLSESERYGKKMPPNELDSVWMSRQDITRGIYYGHIFLIGIQKLRLFAKIAGFDIKKVHYTRSRLNSMLLFPVFYPFIVLVNWIAYKKNLRKNTQYDMATKKKVYKEIFKLAISPGILTNGHLMVEFVKMRDSKKVADHLSGVHTHFGST